MTGSETPEVVHPAAGGGAGETSEAGRARVRRLLVVPLQLDGLKRRTGRGLTAEDHDAFLVKLCDRLQYMTDDGLRVLGESVLHLAEGKDRSVWPTFATVWNTAVRIEAPPDDERHIMTTWLRSIEGPHARAGGYLVELHAWLRRYGIPPSAFAMERLRAEADERRRRHARFRRLAERGEASGAELAELEAYARQAAYCERLVADGERRRRGGA